MEVDVDRVYQELLDRAYRIVTPRVQRRAEIPRPEVQILPRRTIIANFEEIAKRLNRSPSHMAKFFQKELGMPGMLEGGQLILHAEKSPKTIEAVYERYLKQYVVCPVCGSIDTLLERGREGERVWYLRCTACGAVTPVKSL